MDLNQSIFSFFFFNLSTIVFKEPSNFLPHKSYCGPRHLTRCQTCQIDNFRIIRLWAVLVWLRSFLLHYSYHKNLEVLPDCHSVSSPFEAISTFARDFNLTFIETTFKKTEFQMETSDKRRCPKLNKCGPCPGLLLGSLLFFTSSLGLSTSKEYSESGFRIYSNRQSFICSPMELSICINPSLHQIAEHLPSTTLFWKVVFPFDSCFF